MRVGGAAQVRDEKRRQPVHLSELSAEAECPYQATSSPARRAFGGIHTPTMKQPTSMWLFPHQQAEKSLQNQHVLSFNPKHPRTPTRRSDMQKTDTHYRMSACGGARGIRTPDLLIANETRYQLRHSPKDLDSLAPRRAMTQADHQRMRDATRPHPKQQD